MGPFRQPIIDGATEPGLVFFPAIYSNNELVEILDPETFQVHIVSASEPRNEHVFGAGESVIPPNGSILFWLESDWAMSPFRSLAVGRSWNGKRVSPKIHPVEPAGRAGVDLGGKEADAELELWLLHVERLANEYQFLRWGRLDRTPNGLLMPPGSTVAGLWNPTKHLWTALSRPFQVRAEEKVIIPLTTPSPGESWFKAEVKGVGPGSPQSTSLVLSMHNAQFEPDFFYATAAGMHAFWYNLEPGTAVLSGGNENVYLPSQTIELQNGAISHFDGSFVDRRSL